MKLAIVATVAALALSVVSCAPDKPNTDQRVFSPDFEFRVTPDVIPPRALEPISYTVTVRERKSRQPVVNGQGRIFATNADRKTIWDGFTYGPEVGTYHAKLMFITAGEWAMSLQFRRDSTSALIRPSDDWRQMVRVASEPGAPSKP